MVKFTRFGRSAAIAAALLGVAGGVCNKMVAHTAESAASQTGSFTDKRDGQKYKTVTIDDQTWMARNLNYRTQSGSWCYDDRWCKKHGRGRLYTWDAAMKACPAGYHLPSNEEWNILVKAAGGGKAAARKLRAETGWKECRGSDAWCGNGTDDFGFSAFPGGAVIEDDEYIYLGVLGLWWTATEDSGGNAYYRVMDYDYRDSVWEEADDGKSNGASVRCVKDSP